MTRKRKHHFKHLKEKWTKRHKELQQNLWEKHQSSLEWLRDSSKHIATGSLAGMLMLTQPATTAIVAQTLQPSEAVVAESPAVKQSHLLSELVAVLPQQVEPLNSETEDKVTAILKKYFGITALPILQGIRLNRSYGLIGAEQHLMRYPGDTMATHFESASEQVFASSGMAPGRGAWGYFAQSKKALTTGDVLREKYYIAIPTFLSPNWNEHVQEYYAFFKYRKMIVINPENGKAMVAVIGDAGPAEWTGKHLGGSPEVMSYLERHDGALRGPVLYFFIDDPNDTIPLGPITIV